MRNYCRVFHTSLDYLNNMPIVRIFAELEDAAEDLSEERKQFERQMKEDRARANSRSRPRHRR